MHLRKAVAGVYVLFCTVLGCQVCMTNEPNHTLTILNCVPGQTSHKNLIPGGCTLDKIMFWGEGFCFNLHKKNNPWRQYESLKVYTLAVLDRTLPALCYFRHQEGSRTAVQPFPRAGIFFFCCAFGAHALLYA